MDAFIADAKFSFGEALTAAFATGAMLDFPSKVLKRRRGHLR